MFLKSIKINSDIVLESNRISQSKHFKIKKRTYLKEDRRKPIYDQKTFRQRRIGYEKKKVTERTFVIHKEGYQLDFKDNLTIIVGDNGCGKTHFFQYLEPKFLKGLSWFMNEEQKKESAEHWISNKTYTLTFSKNPTYLIQGNKIHKDSFIENFQNSKPQGTFTAGDINDLWTMQENSNGENILDFLNSLTSLKDSLIVLDEPETSLSLKSQKHIKSIFSTLLKQNNQLIIITHSPLLMELSTEVYDFEKKEYVNTDDYIKEQLK